MMLVYLGIVAVLAFAYLRLPSAFLPTEDQGYVITDVQLAPGAAYQRTLATTKEMEQYYMDRPSVVSVLSLQDSASRAWARTPVWHSSSSRTGRSVPNKSATAEADRSNEAFAGFDDGTLFSIVPPPPIGMGAPVASPCVCRTELGWVAKHCWPPVTS